MPASDQLTQDNRYQLIPRTLIFLTCSEHVLLVKGAPNKRLWANLYNGLGGHIEQGEGVLRAARRELVEESGLEVEGLHLVGVITIDTGYNPGIGLFVLRGDLQENPDKGFPRSKISVEGILEWIAREDLHKLPLVEDLYTLLPVVLSIQPGDSPFSARYSYDDSGQLKIEFDPMDK